MAARKDLLLDSDNDLLIVNGDLVIGDSDEQNIEIILKSNKGEFLENPTLGVGMRSMLNSIINPVELQKNIRMELQKDGYDVSKLTVNPDFSVEIDAHPK